jgi:thymidylate synthase (FAD)
VPITFEAFSQYRMGATELSAAAMAVVKKLLAGDEVTQETSAMSKREWRELMASLGRET